MQAVLLPDHNRLLRDINALLRAFGIAQLAADALIRHKITGFLFLGAAKGKSGPFYRQFGKVEPLYGSLVGFE